MAEAESVSAHKATLLNPTEEDETIQVLRRRLFEFVDEEAANAAADAYRARWRAKRWLSGVAGKAIAPQD